MDVFYEHPEKIDDQEIGYIAYLLSRKGNLRGSVKILLWTSITITPMLKQ